MSSTKADLVVLGPARTMDPTQPWVDALAVHGGRIMAFGAAARDAVDDTTEIIDASHGMVLPGFQDAHVHPPFAGRHRLNVWLNDAHGRAEYIAIISAYAAKNPQQPWIVGGGWALEHFPGGIPRREDLDSIVPDRPVFLFNKDLHGAWVNSKALELAAITRRTPDPADGRIERDPTTGEPSGMLHEGAAYAFERDHVPRPDTRAWQAAILNAQQHLHTLGITGWQDAWVTPDTFAAYNALAEHNQLSARVVGALWWERNRGLEQISDLVERRAAGTQLNFRPTTVKIMVDGTLENYTGALLEPYCDGCGGDTHNLGLSFVDHDLLAAAVTELDRLNFQVHMHAIGDRAVRDALDAVQAARTSNGHRCNRHHIAHLQIVEPTDIARFQPLDVTANCQAFWAKSEPQMDELTLPFIGPIRGSQQYPFGALKRAGARLAMGSDWAVTTADPLAQIEVAVRRIDPADHHSPPFLPEQCLSLDTALEAFTAGSAYINSDDDAGTLQLGQRADLAVLDRNLYSHPTDEITDTRVTATIAAGRIVHHA